MTALVEPPEGDLGLMESEGGCRLILRKSWLCNSGLKTKDRERASRSEETCSESNCESGLLQEPVGGPWNSSPPLAVRSPGESASRRVVRCSSTSSPLSQLAPAILEYEQAMSVTHIRPHSASVLFSKIFIWIWSRFTDTTHTVTTFLRQSPASCSSSSAHSASFPAHRVLSSPRAWLAPPLP